MSESVIDVVCVGESMALVTPDPVAPLASGGAMRLDVAGAESTVACYLAQLGLSAAWASRVGADPLGELLLSTIGKWGVDTSAVGVDSGAPTGVFFKDPGAPTGVFFKDAGAPTGVFSKDLGAPTGVFSKNPSATAGVFLTDPGARNGTASQEAGTPDGSLSTGAGAGTQVYYYRAGSAASRLGPETLIPRAGLTHLSGITPALSASCAALVDRLLGERRCSFDVNYRPGLWPVSRAAPVLLDLARRASIVFVGLDEAQTLWGVSTAADVRSLLPEPEVLVVKDGAVGATSFRGAEPTFVATPPVDVVEPVGAGDAFAAGYLAALLRGHPERDRLALGHRVAAAALGVTGDVATLGPAALGVTGDVAPLGPASLGVATDSGALGVLDQMPALRSTTDVAAHDLPVPARPTAAAIGLRQPAAPEEELS